jgi:hypothetical protein
VHDDWFVRAKNDLYAVLRPNPGIKLPSIIIHAQQLSAQVIFKFSALA